ncbi:MAG: hypothetical protein J5835_06605 [Bacteroidales bacterium]|nr:hypothetical protein [Bacteroidales bacterium]
MRRRVIAYLCAIGLLVLPRAVCAQAPAIDESTRREIQGRLSQYLDIIQRINDLCTAKLPVSPDVQCTDSYLRMIDYRLKGYGQNLKSMGIRWETYFPLHQYEISQDEDLMSCVESFELMKQEAADSLEVRMQMLKSLQSFSEAQAMIASLDSTYNRLGKQAFQLSLTPKTAPLLEKQKMKEQMLFATVQEKFDEACEAGRYGLVSTPRMEALKDSFAVLKNKSDTIQAMQYKPLIQRIKDYLIGLAAVAILLMFVNMVRQKIKAAKAMRENMKKYKESLNLNGKDDYPTI